MENTTKAIQIFKNADALAQQVEMAHTRGQIDAVQATHILHQIIKIEDYRQSGVDLMNQASPRKTWQDRKIAAQKLLKAWNGGRVVVGIVTVKKATVFENPGYDVRVDGYIVMFERSNGRTFYLGERRA